MLIDNGKVIVEESDLVETFNDRYINIVKKTSGQKPCNFVLDTKPLEDELVKNQLNMVLNNIFSPYSAAYRESYRTQHVFSRLFEE